MKDTPSTALLVPWLTKHEQNYHASEAAIALGRIGTPEAIEALWTAVRSEVPNRKVFISRYLQHGPRPEEYALLRGLLVAGARLGLEDVPLVVAMLPGTFQEKPRFEDRMRPESQRVLLGRMPLESGALRRKAVALLVDVPGGAADEEDFGLGRGVFDGRAGRAGCGH
ncbi:MAG: hypothetical protein IID43_04945, partial [Planctomycetes bacterium]|nr:hypothetical protein [Planctomycetota bacterium]